MSLVSSARTACLLLVVSVLALASTASAARGAAAEPNLAVIALAGSDFGGAKVSSQRFTKPQKPATASYTRVFAEGTRLGTVRLLVLETETSLFPTPVVAAKQVQDFRRYLATRNGRAAFGNAIASGLGKKAKAELKRVAVSTPVSLGGGQSSVHVASTFVLKNKASFSVHLALVQTDRAVALLGFSPMPGSKLTRGHLRQLGRLQGARFLQGFTVASTAAPTITGTVAPAQTLTASTGDWSGSPSSYAYQWSRCDSTATTCTDIAGATAATYTVTPEDTGFVLRTTVTAQNSVTSASTTSPVTTPVA
jgi:Ig domain of plant-specific actin-binding protein